MVKGKKKDIDLKQIQNLYLKTYEKLKIIHLSIPPRKHCQFSYPKKSVEEIKKFKVKFTKLRDKYKFNEYNEEKFKTAVGKLLDFEKSVRRGDGIEINETLISINKLIDNLNNLILIKRKSQFEKAFGNEEVL